MGVRWGATAKTGHFKRQVTLSTTTRFVYQMAIVALPILVVYLFLQRHFVRGMLAGALKE